MAKSNGVITPVKSANKSWVELCDEDSLLDSSPEKEKSFNTPNGNRLVIKTEFKQELEECDQVENLPLKSISEVSTNRVNTEIKVEKEDSPPGSTYASILKSTASKSNTASPNTPVKLGKAKTNAYEVNPIKSVKREIQKEFLHEDLSISSHLDIFHMESPLKLECIDEGPLMLGKSLRKRSCPPKLIMDEDAVMADDFLMPSPKKVTRLSTRRKRESGESPLTCKRSKLSYGGHTPKCVLSVNRQLDDIESDEQILARRQKQIDYGKNTIGYDRYCQMVPKEKRHRKHPHTPPKHIKYSRRAWDGLIKQWRQKLHFWDPPSEGGGNIDDLDMSSMSEVSSDSQPGTPRDERKVRRSTRVSTRSSSTSESSIITDESGCTPLKN